MSHMRYRVGLETRGRILEATRDLMSEVGLEGTTIKAICERAGILAGSFYNLFPSKEEVILTVVGEAIREVEPDPSQPADVAELVDAYVDFIEEKEATARVYLVMAVTGGLTDPRVRERMLAHHADRVERFGEALARQRPDMSPSEVRSRVVALLAALNGFAFHRMLEPSFDLRGQARGLLAIG